MRQVGLQLEDQLLDNKSLNTTSVTTTRGSTSGQQTLNTTSVTTTRGSTSGQQTP